MINLIPNRDADGNLIIKSQIAMQDMLFHPRVFDFTTSKYNSLCNKNSELTNLGDIELLFLDATFNQLIKGESESESDYQDRLDLNCKFTWAYFTPSVRYAIKAGSILYVGNPSDELDCWFEIAPHIPKAMGGSVPFMDGGLPLDNFPEKTPIRIDGGSCAVLELDEVNYTHRIGVKIEHSTGEKLKITGIFDIYF